LPVEKVAWQTEARAETAADPAQVWELWEDPARWPEWNDEIRSGTLEGPFQVGSVALIKPKGFPSLRFRLVGIEPGRLLTSETHLPGARLRHDHIVERDGKTTVIRNRMSLLGPTARFWGLLYGWRLRRSVRGFVARERELAEAA
jgi:polyketide cyclase/dehydrase/lipid transport protein